MTEKSDNAKKIFVGNLDFSVTTADIKALFEASAGPVEGVNIRKDRVTKQPKGFAFVTFVNADDAQRALDVMQNTVHRGRLLSIKPQIARGKSKPKKKTKASLWGPKSQDGWYTPSSDTADKQPTQQTKQATADDETQKIDSPSTEANTTQ